MADELICKRRLTNGAERVGNRDLSERHIVKLRDREPFGQVYALRGPAGEAKLGWEAMDEQRVAVKLLCSEQDEMSLELSIDQLATKMFVRSTERTVARLAELCLRRRRRTRSI